LLLDGLYTIVEKSSQKGTVLLSDASHPIFEAHFPSNPILPGFVHLEIIEELFDIQITGIKKAKYSALVLPSERLDYIKENKKVVVTCNNKEVASFNIV
jgi:3-hydroxyacyl-[acyl-carrier-protein] dehydratase